MVGNYTAKNLLSYCGSAAEVFKLKKSTLLRIPGVGENTVLNITQFKEFDKYQQELEFVKKHHIHLHIYYQSDYPHRLKNIPDAPVILFSLGNADLNAQRMIGVVGTRKNTPYGRQITEELIEGLEPYHCTIVSGMAYGIDIIAHKAALKHQIPTLGVMAHGLDRVYPSVHLSTARKMVQSNGALLSEHVSGTKPDRENFPKRNRIVAGLIDVLLVIETDLKGGSMITAKLALNYDREVMAVPGRSDDLHSKGCNYLIKTQQAALLDGLDELLNVMNWKKKDAIPAKQAQLPLDLSAEYLQVLQFIKTKSTASLDDIIASQNLNSSRLAFILLELEFRNLVLSLPGKMYKCLIG